MAWLRKLSRLRSPKAAFQLGIISGLSVIRRNPGSQVDVKRLSPVS
jgi:hypothetical protein